MDLINQYGPLLGLVISLSLNAILILQKLGPVAGKAFIHNWEEDENLDRAMAEAQLNAKLQQQTVETSARQLAITQLSNLATQQVTFLQEVILGLLKREQVPEKLLLDIKKSLEQVLDVTKQLNQKLDEWNAIDRSTSQ